MSFDLYVWHEPTPITADGARAKLERWGEDEPEVFKAHPAVTAFYDALVARFPALESFSDEDIDRLGAAGGDGDGRGPAQSGERGFGAQPVGVVAGGDQPVTAY